MKSIFGLVLTFSLLANLNIVNSSEIVCFPVSVCNILNEFKPNFKKDIKITQGLDISGDLHHFSPSIQDIKNLVDADYIIMPPEELFPSRAKISQLRENIPSKKGKTLTLDIPHSFYKTYEKSLGDLGGHKHGHEHKDDHGHNHDHGPLSHFWLYPDILCHTKNEIHQQIKRWSLFQNESNFKCDNQKYFNDFQKLSKKISDYIIIETHDAMGPFFRKVGINYMALKGGGHHAQITTDTLKKIKQIRNLNKKIIWFVETNIHQSDFWKSHSKKEDIVIHLNSLGNKGEKSTGVLDKILKELSTHELKKIDK